MLVYLVLLAPIDPLVISSGFRQVFALLLSSHFLSEPLNPWDISIRDCNVETPSTSTCTSATGRTFDPTRSTLVLIQAKHNRFNAKFSCILQKKSIPKSIVNHTWLWILAIASDLHQTDSCMVRKQHPTQTDNFLPFATVRFLRYLRTKYPSVWPTYSSSFRIFHQETEEISIFYSNIALLLLTSIQLITIVNI